MRSFLLCLLLVSISVPALAENDWSVFARLGARQVADPNLALVSRTDALFHLEFGGSRALTETFSVELALGISPASEPIFDGAGTADLFLFGVRGAAVARFPLTTWLQFYGRGGGGLDLPRLSIGMENGVPATEMRLVPILLGVGGVEISQRSSSFSVSLEGGYSWAPFDADFSGLEADRDEDVKPKPLATAGIPVGRLDLSGWLAHIGFAFRF